MCKCGFKLEDFSVDDVLCLLNIYLSEWEHRDELLWKQVFKYFYVIVIVLFLPNIASFLQIELPKFPKVIFPLAALILAFVFLYVSIGYAKRLEASGETYQNLLNLLPKELQRISLSDSKIKCGKFFARRMSVVICTLMFFLLLFLALVMVCYNLTH